MKLKALLLALAITMVYGTISSCSYYPPPEIPVPIETLVGTWQWRANDEYAFTRKPSQSSLMILRDDGHYEIHNPPDYISVPPPEYVREGIPLNEQAK